MTTQIDDTTPLMKQYNELKAQAGDALLFFRMGDFYELFGDDAIEAARILEITLTSRDKNKPNPTPMAGVPHHSAQGYIQRLLKAGKKVAIGEQMEDPAASRAGGKTIVRRELVRTFTPGVQFDVEGAEACYIAAVLPVGNAATPSDWVIACLDASTGEALASARIPSANLAGELSSLPIKHILRFETPALDTLLQPASGTLIEKLPTNYLSIEQADKLLKDNYGLAQLDAFLPEAHSAHALGILLVYTLRTQKQERLAHLRLPQPLHKPTTLVLGPRTIQHLDLLPSAEGGTSLYSLINRTRSALGARHLKRWLTEPLSSPAEIARRQEAVNELTPVHESVSKATAEIYDLERIIGRVSARLANPRDTLALGRSLAQMPELARLLGQAQGEAKAPALRELARKLTELSEPLAPLAQRILATQADDAPLVSREGGIFKLGTHADLDRLLTLAENGSRWLVELETREREATGIPSLKVRYNRVFGYYIEITQAHVKNAPAHYQRKQTTVGAERFFTEELKKFEDEIVNAGSRQRALEQQLFDELLGEIRALTMPVMDAARALGELDSLASLANLAQEPGWCFPAVDDSLELDIRQGRHPLVDTPQTRGTFVPNDLTLSPASRLTLVITGPNMGGKSTVMRQTALIVILGQMGAPVPAESARWGAVSRLYTRIGAHDAIARGQSTFMVEMTELAHILHHADERSLVVLDEIGRGTSTYDGISVAWSSLEWICRQIRCRTLFATHYHELTRLAAELPGAANAHLAVEGARAKGAGLRFLYLLREGPAQESFGIHVARIAGLPKGVVDRAWGVLEELESHALHSGAAESVNQLSLFSTAPRGEVASEEHAERSDAPVVAVEAPHPALAELETTDINSMTPVQALNFVARLQQLAAEQRA